MRVLLAHPKIDDDGMLETWRAQTKALLAQAGEPDAEVVLGLEDYRKFAAADGSFSAWAACAGRRRDTSTGELLYGLVACPTRVVGKAVAGVVEGALAAGTPVVVLDGGAAGEGAAVVRVVEHDGHDWKTGWRLVCA